MTFGGDLFLQDEPHVLFTDQPWVGSVLVKCHQINAISSNWQTMKESALQHTWRATSPKQSEDTLPGHQLPWKSLLGCADSEYKS